MTDEGDQVSTLENKIFQTRCYFIGQSEFYQALGRVGSGGKMVNETNTIAIWSSLPDEETRLRRQTLREVLLSQK